MQFSKRLAHIELSTISHAFALVRDLRTEGKDITELCVGEPKCGPLNNGFDIVIALLNHHGWAVLHSDAFQSSSVFRSSFAASEQALQQAVEKIHAFIQCLSPRSEEASA